MRNVKITRGILKFSKNIKGQFYGRSVSQVPAVKNRPRCVTAKFLQWNWGVWQLDHFCAKCTELQSLFHIHYDNEEAENWGVVGGPRPHGPIYTQRQASFKVLKFDDAGTQLENDLTVVHIIFQNKETKHSTEFYLELLIPIAYIWSKKNKSLQTYFLLQTLLIECKNYFKSWVIETVNMYTLMLYNIYPRIIRKLKYVF